MDIITFWDRFCAPMIKARIASERGASIVEYALLVALIAVVAIGGISFLGGNVKNKFSAVGSSLA